MKGPGSLVPTTPAGSAPEGWKTRRKQNALRSRFGEHVFGKSPMMPLSAKKGGQGTFVSCMSIEATKANTGVY